MNHAFPGNSGLGLQLRTVHVAFGARSANSINKSGMLVRERMTTYTNLHTLLSARPVVLWVEDMACLKFKVIKQVGSCFVFRTPHEIRT